MRQPSAAASIRSTTRPPCAKRFAAFDFCHCRQRRGKIRCFFVGTFFRIALIARQLSHVKEKTRKRAKTSQILLQRYKNCDTIKFSFLLCRKYRIAIFPEYRQKHLAKRRASMNLMCAQKSQISLRAYGETCHIRKVRADISDFVTRAFALRSACRQAQDEIHSKRRN